MKKSILFLALLLQSIITFSQELTSPELLIEKAYVHTDRSLYFPGDTVWFKVYLTDGHHNAAILSDRVYTELLAPDGSSIAIQNYIVTNGYSYGQFFIPEEWIGGIYTLKGYTQWMQNNGETSFFSKKITVQKVIPPKLLMKLDFDKEAHGPGTKVSAKLDLKTVENLPLKNQEILVDVSVAGAITQSLKYISNPEGVVAISFTLPDSLETTDVLLNAKVPYLGTTESISRSVPVVLDAIDLKFLPEGGILLANFENNIAFKALNSYGKPADIEGEIKDSSGAVVAQFASYHDGMGDFVFRPKAGEKYTGHITKPFISKKEYPIPAAVIDGFAIRVNEQNEEFLGLTILSSKERTLNVSIHDLNKEMMTQKLSVETGYNFVPLNTSQLAQGIIKITLQDPKGELKAERLAFVNRHKDLTIEITTDKEQYATREKITVHLKTKDQNGQPVPANLSVATVDNTLLSFADDRQNNIASYLLMSSELKGKIHKPNFYFNPNETRAQKALDYVLLTHGWRSYLTQTPSISEAKYAPEQRSIRKGYVTDLNGNPSTANLLLFDTTDKKVLMFKTNEKGEFQFKVGDREHYTLIAYNDKREKLIIVKDNQKDYVNRFAWSREQQKVKEKQAKELAIRNVKMKKPLDKAITVSANTMGNTDISMNPDASSLNEVVITGFAVKKEKKALGYAVSSIETEEIETDISRVLNGKVAGINITTQNGLAGGANLVNIRGTNSFAGDNTTLYVVDGIPLDQDFLNSKQPLRELNPSNIDRIEILKGLAATTLYGTQGKNGVILITTKNNQFYQKHRYSKVLNNRKYKNYTFKTFFNYANNFKSSRQVSFYIPQYEDYDEAEERTDFRETIYWNPVIQTNGEGEAQFSYYNSDANTSFNISVEGVGANGTIGRAEKDYATNSPVSIDFKMPAYMTVNDEVTLQITLKNNLDKEITGTMDALLPEELELLESNGKGVLRIPAKGSINELISLRPKTATSSTQLTLEFEGDKISDRITRNVAITSPYFPFNASLSGSKSERFTLPVAGWEPETMTAEFSLYTDVVGSVMDGIESIIREPYGCFEQTSSATYPNVMVLKYLKESGKSNPEVERKAMEYIIQGYKRLVGFETSKGGFEWFGKTPPHETLTAYGILEFTEMKEVYDQVDQKMIDRTVAWLLSRRDGNGGFKKSEKGYDSFASSPTDVANAYIVYALSEAGLSDSLEKEYQHVLKDALDSNDSYKLALVACAAFNMNKKNNAKTLVKAILKNIENHGAGELPVQNTITRSYGKDKETETLAFTILALLKQQNPDTYFITQLVESLLERKKGKRFGATQSTVMSLKALITYTQSFKRDLEKDGNDISLIINDEVIKEKIALTEDGILRIEDLGQHIVKGENEIAVLFRNEDASFPYSFDLSWKKRVPPSAADCPLELNTSLSEIHSSIGNTVRHTTMVTNKTNDGLGMVTAIVGVPSGTSAQPWQLKELIEKDEIAYYEVFDNYIVFYWRSFKANEIKTIAMDLKVEISGSYLAPASCVYLYYGEEFKQWVPGTSLDIAL